MCVSTGEAEFSGTTLYGGRLRHPEHGLIHVLGYRNTVANLADGPLLAYFGSRPADRLSRRMCTNILVTVDSSDAAAATTYFATYRVDGYTAGTLLPPRLPGNVGHYEDTFRRVDGQWLIATRRLHLPFGGPTERLDVPNRQA
ncbi:nuclear transport factor 2 family protein [Streptomyces sp. NPDC102279]|uniref:nuclear transport factor 2 family protein n=1 Tax=Streptomyces sp. NPDC102279 TaxID=3366153 RepID=UPI0037FF1343